MKQWLKRTVCASDDNKKKTRNIQRLFLPSFLGIILCMAGLAGTTWAWFSASIQTKPQTIQAAEYGISVTVDGEEVAGFRQLEAGTPYTVTLTGAGTATTIGGYCVVEGGEKTLCTEQIVSDKTLTFTLIPTVTADYTFKAVWGEYTGTPDIKDGSTVGQKVNMEIPEQTQPNAGEQKPSGHAEKDSKPADSTDTPNSQDKQVQTSPQENSEGSHAENQEPEDKPSSEAPGPAGSGEGQKDMSPADGSVPQN